MPPKTAKLKKKTGNNKTKKKKAARKQFLVDKEPFRLKDNSSQVRIELTDSGDVIKFKADLWPDDANQAWDELQSKGLIKFTTTIQKMILINLILLCLPAAVPPLTFGQKIL